MRRMVTSGREGNSDENYKLKFVLIFQKFNKNVQFLYEQFDQSIYNSSIEETISKFL